MRLERLLAFLQVSPPAQIQRALLQRLLSEALQEVDNPGRPDLERARMLLTAWRYDLSQGITPNKMGDVVAHDLRRLLASQPACSALYREALAALAARLSRWEWYVEGNRLMEDAARCLQAGDAAALDALLGPFEARMEASWEGYCQAPVDGDEVSVETAVAHGALQQAIQAWYDALGLLRRRNPSAALQKAEEAARLTVAVRIFSERQVALYGESPSPRLAPTVTL